MNNNKGIWRLEYFEPLTIEELEESIELDDGAEDLT